MKMYKVLSLQDFCNTVKNQRLPIKIAYKFSKLISQVEKEAQFYADELSKIVDEYAQKENGQVVYTDDLTSIKIIPGKEEECAKEILELRELEIDLSSHSFTIEELDFLEFTPSQLTVLLPLIKN